MKFPTHPRTQYKNNILFEVISQARFPQIMAIREERPAKFQEQIRKNGFPETEEKQMLEFPPGFPHEVKKTLSPDYEYMFFSEERDWQITLAKDFIALKCLEYTKYDEFEARLKTMLEVFWGEYEPPYCIRLGLRYRNLATERLLKTSKDVRAFMPRYVAPEFQEPIGDEVQTIDKTLLFKDDSSTVNIRYIYAELSGKFGKYNLNEENGYIIDIDCFTTEKIRKVENAIATSRRFNAENVRNAFHWSITDDLRMAMGPV